MTRWQINPFCTPSPHFFYPYALYLYSPHLGTKLPLLLGCPQQDSILRWFQGNSNCFTAYEQLLYGLWATAYTWKPVGCDRLARTLPCCSSDGQGILAVRSQGIPQSHTAQQTSHKFYWERHNRVIVSAWARNSGRAELEAGFR